MFNLNKLYNPMNMEYNNLHISLFDTMMKSVNQTDSINEVEENSTEKNLFNSTKLHSVLM